MTLLPACGGGGSSDSSEARVNLPDVGMKGGLDGPAVAVGPFLDGALPRRTPGSATGSGWTTVDAFPGIDLGDTIVMVSNPGDDRLYAGSQNGLIVSFENDLSASGTATFLDLTDRVAVVLEGGLLGMAFHPEFGQAGSPHRRSFFAYYSSHCPLDASRNRANLSACNENYPRDRVSGFNGVYLRLSRFEVDDTTGAGDPDSEQVLLNFRLDGPVHRGGGLAVSTSGHLYLSIGEQNRKYSAQDISDNFNGSTLRLAVNVTDHGDGTWTCPAGSQPPRRRLDTVDEISGLHYCIPDDNPWLDPGGSQFEEYCAIGLRNPFRLSIDRLTQRVWVGDVGENLHEEVNVIECGNNYGWPFREGFDAGPIAEPSSYLGVLTDPVVDFTREQAKSIIGGYVYRGSRLPELQGLYIVGDFIRDTIWSVTLDETTMRGSKTLLTSYAPGNLVTFAQDNDGEVLFTDIYSSGSVHRLERVGEPEPDAPALLSQTGAFSSMGSATPSAFWVPYELNQPFWSDGALKTRFLALPNDGLHDGASEQIGFSEGGDWSFPTGTVLMKHFELPLDETDPSVTTRLETRFMVLGEDDQWYGLTYRWRPNQLEADLLTTEASADYTIALPGGGNRTQTWYFPSRLDCLSCHRNGSGGALGLTTHQLNGNLTYPSTGRTDNQLVSWNDLGMFAPSFDNGAVLGFPKAPAYADVTAPLQDRARSWLDSNCGYCHRPDEVNAGFDLRFTTPFVDQNVLWTLVRDDLGNPGTVVVYPGEPELSALWQRSAAVGAIAMPPLAKTLAETPAVDLLAAWIERLPPSEPNALPVLSNPGDQSNTAGQAVSLSLSATDADGNDLYFDAAGLPEGLTLNHETGAISGIVSVLGRYDVTASASDGPAVSVERFSWTIVASGCGNGSLDAGEQCDDGNTTSGDGCTAACMLELCGDRVVNNAGAEDCEPPDTALCDSNCRLRAATCGDGYKTPPEQCDDGNAADGDGCTNACTLEFCGDGAVNDAGAEDCEPPGTASCTDRCTLRALLCGDGFTAGSEECDDGNLVDGDGCSSACTVEVPPGCGDGEVDAGEECDDGNLARGDGCGARCTLEVCGDGIVNNADVEECEPPNTALCGADCTFRAPVCGDGYRTAPEQCDDGNLTNDDGCTAGCVLELCGDGVVNGGGVEECEPPGTEACTEGCERRETVCGDGFVTGTEECDDGNLVDGDGCSAVCRTAALGFCGDGMVGQGEECDDGNLESDDGCSDLCRLEDAGTPDPGAPMPDAGIPDAGEPSGPMPPASTSGGGCSVSRRSAPFDPLAVLACLGIMLITRRRRRIRGGRPASIR